MDGLHNERPQVRVEEPSSWAKSLSAECWMKAAVEPHIVPREPTIDLILATAGYLEALLKNAAKNWEPAAQPTHMFADQLPCPPSLADDAHGALLNWMQDDLARVADAVRTLPDPDEPTTAQQRAWHHGRVL